MKPSFVDLEAVIEQAESLLSTVYLIEKGDGWLTCLLCGRKGDHDEDVEHKKGCWFEKASRELSKINETI